MNATIKGVVENGMIRLPDGVVLPENQSVYIIIPNPSSERTYKMPSVRFANPEDAKKFELKVTWEDKV